MSRGRIVVAGAVLALGGGAQALAQETATPDYSAMFLKSGKQSVQATLGAYCHPGDTTPENCKVVPKYPLMTTGTLKLKPGAKVELLFRADAGTIAWRAARLDGNGNEKITAVGQAKLITTKTKRRWQITLPKKLSAKTVLLGFDAQFPNAYSSFEVGVKLTKEARSSSATAGSSSSSSSHIRRIGVQPACR